MPKQYKCVACKRPVELHKEMGAVASGPACIPCFWAAKLKYELGITSIEDIQEPIKTELFKHFQHTGARWPDDLIDRWQTVDFEKVHSMSRWWFENRTADGRTIP